MKKPLLVITSVLLFALSGATGQAALSYWDGNGSDPGAGSDPLVLSGLWGTSGLDLRWNDAPGTGVTNTWVNGDTAVFSAGGDATNAFDVYIDASFPPSVGGFVFEEGPVTLQAGASINMTNEFECPILANTNASILADLGGTCGIIKTGPGRVALGGSGNGYGGTNTVIEGILAATVNTGLGSTMAPTVVSNGATLEPASSAAIGEQAIIYGMGVSNIGALHNTGTTPQANGWSGGVILGSDAKISQDGGVTWTFGTQNIIGTSGGSNFNVTFGGNSGTIRLNSTVPNNRCVDVGSGKLIKEGTCALRFENAAIAHELQWLDGNIISRWGGNFIQQDVYAGPPAPIYVGPLADRIQSANTAYTLSCLIVISNGANPQIDCSGTATFTSSGRITGAGGLIKRNTATVTLNGWQDYAGGTLMSNGIVVLGAAGTLTNSTPITVLAPGSFDVTAQVGGFTLLSGQTLAGDGTISGDVIANGTLAPGGSIGSPYSGVGTMTFNNNLVINGNLLIEVDKSLTPTSDSFTMVGTATNAGTGTLTVSNIGATLLAAGDIFQIFATALTNGNALTVTGMGATWTNRLAENGTIEVLTAPTAVPATGMTITAAGGNNYTLQAIGGPNTSYNVYSHTNITAAMASWWIVGTTNSDGSGLIQFDAQATNSPQYYRFGQ